MKRTFLSFALVSATLLVCGQRTGYHGRPIESPFNGDRGTDTVVTSAVAAGPLTLYSGSIGYIIGNNTYEDKAKAQVFDLGGNVVVDELLFFFGGKSLSSGDPNSKVVAQVWTLDGTGGTTTTGTDAACPGTVVAQGDILVEGIDTTGGFTGALLGPVNLSGAFAVGFDLTSVTTGDTVGLVTTEFGNASSVDNSWELWSDDTWHSIGSAWTDGDLDLAIAVVFTGIVGVEEATLNGVQMQLLNGNVVDDRLDLAFTLPVASKASVLVNDATGRQITIEALGNRAAGKHTTSLDASAWGAGQYYITLVSNGTMLAKKVVKH